QPEHQVPVPGVLPGGPGGAAQGGPQYRRLHRRGGRPAQRPGLHPARPGRRRRPDLRHAMRLLVLLILLAAPAWGYENPDVGLRVPDPAGWEVRTSSEKGALVRYYAP